MSIDQSHPTLVDGYRILELLGSGGEAHVYRAQHPRLPLEVAIKLSKRVPDAKWPSTLRFEGELLSQRSHPCICGVRDIGEFEEKPYLVLDLVRGHSLEHAFESSKLTWKQFATCLMGIASGVGDLHSADIFHLDLKPLNIVMDEAYHAVIIDFGRSKTGAMCQAAIGTSSDRISGTLCYMAPEQATHDYASVGPETDIFGLGGIMYRFLCGTTPYPSARLAEMMTRLEAGNYDRERLDACEAPVEVKSLVQGCLKADPNDRFPSAEALSQAIAMTM